MERFALKPRLCFGAEPLEALGELAGKRVMIVTDGFLAGSGLLDRVTARLAGAAVEIFDRVEPDPSLSLVAEGTKRLRDFAPDAVLAFGGGSPMDCAKAMRYFSEVHCALWCIPTTAGTGSEVTAFAVLTDTDRGVKYPLVDEKLLPDTAILDPSFLDKVPPKVTADTGMDVLTHGVEAYVATGASPFSDALAEKAVALAYANLPAAFRGDSAAKGRMLYASCLAGMAFNGAGLGACHALSHALGGKLHLPHGRLNALLLPEVIGFNSGGNQRGGPPGPAVSGGNGGDCSAKYGRLAGLCGLAAHPRALAAGVARLRNALAIPATLKLPPELLPELVAVALADVCLPTNPRPVTGEDLERLLKGLAG